MPAIIVAGLGALDVERVEVAHFFFFPALLKAMAIACFCGRPAFTSVRMFWLMTFWEEPGLRGIVFFLRFCHGLHGLHQPRHVILKRANANLFDGEIKQGDKGLELSGGKIKLHREFPWGLAGWRCNSRARCSLLKPLSTVTFRL